MEPMTARSKLPQSWKIRFVSSDSFGTNNLAAEMREENPNYTADDAKTMIAFWHMGT